MLQIAIIFILIAAISCYKVKHPFVARRNTQENSALNSGGYALDYKSTCCIKGIAILFILVGHIAGTFQTVLFTPLPAAGVSLFLMLSGYGLSESYKSKGLKDFWSKKITRVLIPYAIVITLLVLFKTYDIKLIDYVLEIAGIKTTYWYIGYQIKWYIVFFITMMTVPNHNVWVFALISALMFLTLGSLEIEQSPAFLIGVIASKYKDYLSHFSRGSVYLHLMAFAFIGMMFLAIKQHPCVREYFGTSLYSFVQMIHNIAFALCVIAIISLNSVIRKSSFLVFCGIISYEIYLIHFPFYTNVRGNFLMAISLISISIAVSALFYALNGKISNKIGCILKF